MIFYNTVDKRWTDLAFKELASYGVYMFLAGIVNDLYTKIEFEYYEQVYVFDVIFNKFDIEKYNDMLSKTEIYKL